MALQDSKTSSVLKKSTDIISMIVVQHVGEIHPFFTKIFVFYINIGKFGVSFKNTWYERGTRTTCW